MNIFLVGTKVNEHKYKYRQEFMSASNDSEKHLCFLSPLQKLSIGSKEVEKYFFNWVSLNFMADYLPTISQYCEV